MLYVTGPEACKYWHQKEKSRLAAFHLKTKQSYIRMFRAFVGFCICVKAPRFVLSCLEYLVVYRVSVL